MKCKVGCHTCNHKHTDRTRYFLRLHCAAGRWCRTSRCDHILGKASQRRPLFCGPRRKGSGLQIAWLSMLKGKRRAWIPRQWFRGRCLGNVSLLNLREYHEKPQSNHLPLFRAPQTMQCKIAFASPVDSRSRLPQSVQKIKEPITDILIGSN